MEQFGHEQLNGNAPTGPASHRRGGLPLAYLTEILVSSFTVLAIVLIAFLVSAVGRAASAPTAEQAEFMTHKFSVGDHVSWNSEAGHVSGTITKVHTHDVDYKGHMHRCSPDDPQYEIKSDKTDHIAMHRGGALTKK